MSFYNPTNMISPFHPKRIYFKLCYHAKSKSKLYFISLWIGRAEFVPYYAYIEIVSRYNPLQNFSLVVRNFFLAKNGRGTKIKSEKKKRNKNIQSGDKTRMTNRKERCTIGNQTPSPPIDWHGMMISEWVKLASASRAIIGCRSMCVVECVRNSPRFCFRLSKG